MTAVQTDIIKSAKGSEKITFEKDGSVLVDKSLKIVGVDDVYAIGKCCCSFINSRQNVMVLKVISLRILMQRLERKTDWSTGMWLPTWEDVLPIKSLKEKKKFSIRSLSSGMHKSHL
jgi:hypothetical protein